MVHVIQNKYGGGVDFSWNLSHLQLERSLYKWWTCFKSCSNLREILDRFWLQKRRGSFSRNITCFGFPLKDIQRRNPRCNLTKRQHELQETINTKLYFQNVGNGYEKPHAKFQHFISKQRPSNQTRSEDARKRNAQALVESTLLACSNALAFVESALLACSNARRYDARALVESALLVCSNARRHDAQALV
ncbi:hypothetical protein ACROYT_G039236 [Oculina patagonica]